jgi:hypothetical protein
MTYKIKITGIDNNKNKSIWLDYNINLEDNINLKETEIIRKKEISIVKDNQISDFTNSDFYYFSNLIKKKIKNKENMILEGLDNNNKIKVLLDIFIDIKDNIQGKKICICGFSNFINSNQNKYELELKEILKKIEETEFSKGTKGSLEANSLAKGRHTSLDFMCNNELFNTKIIYNIEGEIEYTISKNKRKTKIFDYDIIIFDEISIEKNIYNSFIENNIDNIGLCIILRDNNKVFNKIKKDIICIDINNLNFLEQQIDPLLSLNNLIYNEIKMYNSNLFDNNILKKKLYEFIYKNENNKIIIKENVKEFYDFYINNKKESILIDKNNVLKEKTGIEGAKLPKGFEESLEGEGAKLPKGTKGSLAKFPKGTKGSLAKLPIGTKGSLGNLSDASSLGYSTSLEGNEWNINDEIIYINNNKYELEKIKNIYLIKKKLDIINYIDLIKINKTKKILLSNIKTKFDNKFEYYNNDMVEYNSQQYLNYIIYELKINNRIENIFAIINNIVNIEIYIIELNNNKKIEVLTNKSKNIINNNIKLLKKEIKNLYEYLKNKKNSKSYINYIIKGLWEIIYINRINIFIDINEKNKFISNTNFSLENYKIINKIITYKIKNVFINLSDILNKNIDNIYKLLFIYNCLNLYYETLYIYISKEKYKII